MCYRIDGDCYVLWSPCMTIPGSIKTKPLFSTWKTEACRTQRACRCWDFSLRFKVNTQSFDRKNCCVVLSCTASWPLLLGVSKKSAVMLFWDCSSRNRELFLLFLLVEVVCMSSRSLSGPQGMVVLWTVTGLSHQTGLGLVIRTQWLGPFVDNIQEMKKSWPSFTGIYLQLFN